MPGTDSWTRSVASAWREIDEDRLDAATEKLGRGSAKEGSEPGAKVRSWRRDADVDRQRVRLGSREPSLTLQLERPDSEP